MSGQEHERKRFPLAYTGAIAGLIATASAVLFCHVAIALMMLLRWIPPTSLTLFLAYSLSPWLLVSLSFPAAVVMIVSSVPIDAIIRKNRMRGPWPYMVATTCVIGLCFLLLFGLDPRVHFLSFLVPIASAPCGLLLFYLAEPMRCPEPVDMGDALIIATWFAAWFWCWSSVPASSLPILWASPLDPMAARRALLSAATVTGLPAFMMLGIAAGLTRIWHFRAGVILAGLAWLIPISFVVLYYATPLGPDALRFSAGRQQFEIDWHLNPRKTATGFCVRASNPEARIGWPSNSEVCVASIGSPLTPPPADIPEPLKTNVDGLNCEQQANLRRACYKTDNEGHITTLIVCHNQDCLYEFDNRDLRVSFHITPTAIADWRKTQERSIRLVTELGTGAV